MSAVVSDTGVLSDLDRGQLAPMCLSHSWDMVVPDILYDREIFPFPAIFAAWQGLRRVSLQPDELHKLQRLRTLYPSLSVPDGAALALAGSRGWRVLTGDRNVRDAAERENVPVSDVLWMVDLLFSDGVAGPAILAAALRRISAHPACRVPRAEVERRLRVFA